MKKILFALTLFSASLVATTASAQVSWGLLGGMNISKLSFSGDNSGFSSKNRAGWYVGPKVFFKIPVVGLGVDGAFVYSERTAEISGASKTLRSFEIPLNLRYTIIGVPSVATFYLATGPQIGFNMGHRNWTQVGDALFHSKRSSVSWNVGLGTRLVKHLEVGVGYNFQITKTATADENSLRSNSWQVQLAYVF